MGKLQLLTINWSSSPHFLLVVPNSSLGNDKYALLRHWFDCFLTRWWRLYSSVQLVDRCEIKVLSHRIALLLVNIMQEYNCWGSDKFNSPTILSPQYNNIHICVQPWWLINYSLNNIYYDRPNGIFEAKNNTLQSGIQIEILVRICISRNSSY